MDMKRGINFLDSAELYETYPHINKALELIERSDIDIFMLHEQTSGLTIKGHYEAIEYFF